ncbi:MFS transporter [Sandaracinobacteroides saxicola]|uniref:MFS transporter n=1 Tax=Sandaracinobacteroides saxicola TaxID=2759707 RepID=A0A7G5IFI0_9SPHN|nr:MFS transporter [Sandaracinobacteroides saxicola]QMW22122.1 MFS transporter [Sandaracinobacteroides saxicola]
MAGLGSRLIYGAGAGAFGIKDNGLNYLLLLYYNQVLGLPAQWVGAALMIALVIDGFVDPMIGYASDRTRSRIGRRHPWMYAAAIPAALAFFALWNPPALHDAGLFAWLMVTLVLLRMLMAAYEIPSTSMAAELTGDYDLRTRYVAWRFFFGWAAGIAAGFIAFALFLQPAAGVEVGVLNGEGYRRYGAAAAVAMLAFMLVSALGTQRAMAGIQPLPAPPGRSFRQRWGEIRESFDNPAFLAVLFSGVFSQMANGLGTSLNIYLNSFLWGLTSTQMSFLVLSSFVGSTLALPLSGILSARTDKRFGALALFGAAIAVIPMPYLGRLLGLMPDNGTPALLTTLLLFTALTVMLIVAAAILGTSMLTDSIDVNTAATGRRAEGLYFSANLFVQKCVTGLGVFMSGMLLAAVGFPEGAKPGEVPTATVHALVYGFLGLTVVMLLASIWCLSRYRLTRESHAALRARIAAREG